jgi:hypothetical protein
LRAMMLAAALQAVTPAASPSPPPPPPPPVAESGPAWIDEAPKPAAARRAGISVPRAAGSLRMTKVEAYDTTGLDNVAQYASADDAISGTVFLYYPSLADTGLTFLATDATIRRRFGAATRIADDRRVAVGGVPEAGRRVIYSGASEGARSTAAIFVRAGGWILVLRVSGPASRAAEIAADLDALGAGLAFGRNNPVRAHIVQAEDCAGSPAPNAAIVKPAGADVIGLLLLTPGGARDEKGRAIEDELGRVPDRLCLAAANKEGSVELTYRVPGKTPGLYAPRLFHLVGDAGFMVEATAAAKQPDKVILLRHSIGRMEAYGALDASPGAAQVQAVVDRDESMPLLATAVAKPEGGIDIEIGCAHLREGCKPKP